MIDLALVTSAVARLDYAAVLELVKQALAAGQTSAEVVRAAEAGMRVVGERYEQQEIYLAGLIMAAEIFRSVMDLAQPGWESQPVVNASGRVLLGTVAGDIHDIGKNIAALAFRMFGFTVQDLGVNVPPETFLEAVQRSKPDIVGMSGLLSAAFTSMRDTVSLIRAHAADLEYVPLLVIGGGTIDAQVARFVEADIWTGDAMQGVRECQHELEKRRGATYDRPDRIRGSSAA